MKFWQSLAFTEVEQLTQLAPIVEAVGFHGALVPDHVFTPEKHRSRYLYSEDGNAPFGPDAPFAEPWAAISAMAAVTSRLRFSTAVYIAPLRHPLLVAKSVATAAVISGGRVSLGVGVGWLREEFDQLSRDYTGRGQDLDESIAVMRAVWTGGMVEHHGERYDFDRLQMSPAPPAPIPIWVGGSSERALRRAAVLGDGWIGPGSDPEEVPALVARLHALRREAGRESEPFETIVPVTSPPDPGLFRRLGDQGVTGVVSYPLSYTIGPGTSVAQKRAALERYGEQIIART